MARCNVQVGDVVLMQDTNAIRGSWKMAIVCKTVTDIDRYVRQCEVKYKTDTDKPTSHYTVLKETSPTFGCSHSIRRIMMWLECFVHHKSVCRWKRVL